MCCTRGERMLFWFGFWRAWASWVAVCVCGCADLHIQSTLNLTSRKWGRLHLSSCVSSNEEMLRAYFIQNLWNMWYSFYVTDTDLAVSVIFVCAYRRQNWCLHLYMQQLRKHEEASRIWCKYFWKISLVISETRGSDTTSPCSVLCVWRCSNLVIQSDSPCGCLAHMWTQCENGRWWLIADIFWI